MKENINFTKAPSRMVEKTCIDCGEIFEVANTCAWRAERCHACRQSHELMMRQEKQERARAEYISKRNLRNAKNSPYKLICDPAEAWGISGTYLSMGEINNLIKIGYIEPGCKLKHTVNGTEYVIERVGNALVKKRVKQEVRNERYL